VRYIWAEEEKGFIRIVISYELIDPKFMYKRTRRSRILLLDDLSSCDGYGFAVKGNIVNIL